MKPKSILIPKPYFRIPFVSVLLTFWPVFYHSFLMSSHM